MINIMLLVILSIVFGAVQSIDTTDVGWEGTTKDRAVSGCAAYYSPGLMEKVAVYWGYISSPDEYDDWLRSEGYKGAIALYHKGDKGRKVHILWPDGTLDGPYLAIESVARQHYYTGMRKNMVVDVDYPTAMRHSMRGPMRVVVLYDAGHMIDYTPVLVPGYEVPKYFGCISQSKEGNE